MSIYLDFAGQRAQSATKPWPAASTRYAESRDSRLFASEGEVDWTNHKTEVTLAHWVHLITLLTSTRTHAQLAVLQSNALHLVAFRIQVGTNLVG
jgi:hypothetical protein